jgi:hypothetical protein
MVIKKKVDCRLSQFEQSSCLFRYEDSWAGQKVQSSIQVPASAFKFDLTANKNGVSEHSQAQPKLII